jgi:DNA-directed RNA polymerase specialized sigma24 family protein
MDTISKCLQDIGDISLSIEERHEPFNKLYDRIDDLIWSIASKSTNDYHLAQDLSQTFYLNLWSRSSSYKEKNASMAYLIVLMESLVRNYYARHGRRWEIQNLESILDWAERLDEKGKFYEDDVV